MNIITIDGLILQKENISHTMYIYSNQEYHNNLLMQVTKPVP